MIGIQQTLDLALQALLALKKLLLLGGECRKILLFGLDPGLMQLRDHTRGA